MAVLTREQLIEKIRKYITDDTSDEAIELYEDINDTLDESASDEWKTKFEENDKMWRERYRDIFLGKTTEEGVKEEIVEDDDEKEVKTYEDLFKEE